MKTYLKCVIGLSIICYLVYCQDEENISRLCNNKKTCSECITSDARCGWCKARDYDKIKAPRCEVVYKLTEQCPFDDIVNPGKLIGFVKELALSPPGADPKDIIQVSPQEVNLTLRPRDTYPLILNFSQAVDYPVDLYYLMDLSKSMEDDKDKLYLLGDLLASDMEKVTGNFQLGFGSFVDKVVMPYVSTVPEKLKEPCTGCAAPYGFKNHMKLVSKATKRFKEEVLRANVSGNLDAPEGGFDAIMQAIVCDDDIGWRVRSRKLLVFSTDSGFHYAGDGKLGGIVKPNDGICHLDNDGYYSESTEQDYPSLSQLNQKAIEKKVHMIFAVTANQVDVYRQLSQHLEGASAGILANDSSNVVDLIKEQYNKITSSVQLKDDSSDYIQVKYFSKCLSETLEETSVCNGLRVGAKVSFEVHIRVTHCPTDPRLWQQKFSISPVGLSEALVVNLNMTCECDCETYDFEDRHSSYCTDGNGTYECGICNCYQNRFGHKCECDTEGANLAEMNASCIQPGKVNGTVCNGRGECICGQCSCSYEAGKNYSGDFCECDNNICSYANQKMCNGKGWCDCGTCMCDEGWTGSSCECYQGKENCRAHPGDQICSGNGTCVCGQCVCGKDPRGIDYSGPYCDECPICGAPRCETYRWCVQCKTFQSGKLTEEECNNNCTMPRIEEVDEAKVENQNERICTYSDDDDCRFTFVYGFYNLSEQTELFGSQDLQQEFATSMAYVRVQRTKDCPPPLNILMIVLGVIGGIVAIGLCLLLIWKLLTTIHDRREFAKFEKERQMAKWDTGENPIFKGATSTFKNPTYGAK